MKATEGTSYIDPARRSNFVNATAAGLKCCCYFWLKPGDGAAQARFFLDTIDPVPGERVVIDYEEDGCTLAELKDAVGELIDHDSRLQITVYSGHLLKQQLGDTHDEYLAEHTDLWLAQYTSDFSAISWPENTYPEWSLHQYSQDGSVPHISPCDLDRFNGTDRQCLEWLSPRGAEPVPPVVPDIDRPVVSINLDISVSNPDAIELHVTVNGEEIING